MKPTVRISETVSEQLVAMGARNAARALAPLLLAIALSYLLLHGKVSSTSLSTWAFATAAVVILRVCLLIRLRDSTHIASLAKPRHAAVLSFCAGASFGFVLIFFPDVALFERAMLTAILLGVSSGAISSNLGYQPLFLAYTLPMIGSLGLFWIANPGDVVGTLLAASIGICVILVAVTHAMMAQVVFDAFALSVESTLALEKRTEELSNALASAEKAKSLAEESSSSKTRFIAAASHDLRQPVHVLNLYGAALASADLSPVIRVIADDMTTAVASLSSQINTLLDISELDGGHVEPQIELLDLSSLTAGLCRDFRALAEDKKIDLVNTAVQSAHVYSDAAMLSRILRNLCGNAIKYTHEGSVTLSIEDRGDTVALLIEDTGIGIDSCDTDKVFEEFYQAANLDRDKSLGMGLGLSIVERLVRTLDHTIEMQSTPGVGTRVSVVMACAQAGQVSVPPAQPTANRPRIELPALPDGFWLHLVDDDDSVSRSMRAMLEAREVRVTISSSAAETHACLDSREPSAVLVDLHLQGGDSGLHVVDALKLSHPTVPVALITGDATIESELLVRYPDLLTLQKPVPMDELVALLDYLARSRVPADSRPPVLDRGEPAEYS